MPASIDSEWLLCTNICNMEMLQFLWVLTVNERYIVLPQNVAVFVKHESILHKLCVCVEYLLSTSHDCGLFEDIPQYS